MNDLVQHVYKATIADEGDLDEWQNFATTHASTNPFLDAAWYRILGDAFKVERLFLMCKDERGRILGVAPLFFSRSLIVGPHLSSLEDGWHVIDQSASFTLLHAARSLLIAKRAKHLVLRGLNVPSATIDYKVDTLRRIVNTSEPANAIFAGLDKKNRWCIRQASKLFTFEHDARLERLDTFYHIYAKRMRDLGAPVMSIDYVRALKRHFGSDRLKLFFVKQGDREIGGMLCLKSANGLFNMHSAVDREMMSRYANYLLYWRAIEFAANSYITIFDFGRSRPGSTTHFFKSKWPGTDQIVPQSYFLDEKRAFPGRLSAAKNQKSFIRAIWKHTPLPIVNLIGSTLNRRLPIA